VQLSDDAPCYELRDLHGASRALAYLSLAAAPYVLITSLLTPGIGAAGAAAITVISVLMAVVGSVCWRLPKIMPRVSWFIAPILSTLLISGLNLATHDASTGAQLFYLWPVLYAANFLSRRVAYLNLALVFAGDAAVVFTVLGAGKGAADWVALLLAMTMAVAVVQSLRVRADKLRGILERQAHDDHLTGLANRRSFDESLARAGAMSRRADDTLALITVDLDRFKEINDSFGHSEGDRVLQGGADAMRSVAGESGVAARLGGDEFVLLLRANRPAAVGVADALRGAVAARTDLPGGAPGLSIGIAVMPGDADTIEELVAASDSALYEAKTAGRGRVSVAVPRHNVDRIPRYVPNPRP
jgi:diguanylate cyclase (GGDEF)-like protein